jgi:hypothetical protein
MPMSSRRRSEPEHKHWFTAEEGKVHERVFDYVATVERQQWETFNRFVQLESLYDPNSPAALTPTSISSGGRTEQPGLVVENVIASNVDTVAASVSAADVRPRFMVDDANWSTVKRAKALERYAEAVGKLTKIPEACRKAFKGAAKKGTGIVKVYVDPFDEVKVEHVRIDDIIVDEAECRNGGLPRQMHRRMTNVDRDELRVMFPDHVEAIDRAQTGKGWSRLWAGYRPLVGDELVAIESHKLPIGKPGSKNYRCGRHTICIDGVTLLDEDWEKPFFPYACMVWEAREAAFYGISLSEGIAGIQRALNKRNLQIDRGLDQGAFPTTYVDMADAALAIQSISRLGSIAVVKGQRPTTVAAPAVHPEVYQSRIDLKNAASENSGVSRMASQAVKPAGIDSGVAMREYRDQSSQRFAMQEKAFEQFVLDVYWLVLDCCKDLGEAAPVVTRKVKFGAKRIAWKDVDMGEVKVQMAAASTLSRTPTGRYQSAMEMAQAGVIDTDEFRTLLDHPDIDRVLSLYTEMRKSIELDIEAIEDGYTVMPEPFGNLAMMIRMGQMAYLRDRNYGGPDGEGGAPEEVLEGLRDYVVNAAHLQSQATMTEDPAAMPGAMPMDPAAAPPVAALAPQAMQLVAG